MLTNGAGWLRFHDQTSKLQQHFGFYNGTLLGMNVSVYHSAIDPDGTTLAMGWDTNLDGVVDVPVSAPQGFTVFYIPIPDWNTVPDTEQQLAHGEHCIPRHRCKRWKRCCSS
ncbi:MAG: hypothetical protein CM15mP78_12960 [Candidatus Poseidoniales archaeon]|nr:MAG: hypothetical protein CM15mP78_12960 [Candidatus Poseidoniales archaeon]